MPRVERLAFGRWAYTEINLISNGCKSSKCYLQNVCSPLQNHNINIGNESVECVANFKYLGIALTNSNCTYDEIKII